MPLCLFAPALVAAPVPAAPIVRRTLPSGVHLIVAPRPDARLVALEIRVRGAGSGAETAEENGLAHAIEHMVFKGSGDSAPGAFDAAFERMGGEVSAQTDRVSTAYRVVVLPEHAEAALTLLLQMLTKPALRDSDWARERTVIEREMGVAQSDPVKQGLQALAQTAYPNDAHGQPIMGSPANVARFSANDLRAFHAAHYLPAHFTVSVCGAVSADAVAKVLAGLPAGNVAEATASPATLPEIGEPRRAPLPPAEAQSPRKLATLTLGFPVLPLASDPKRAAVYDVLAALLARGGGGLLPARFRAAPSLETFGVDAGYETQADTALFVVRATGTPRNIGLVEDALMDALTGLAQRLADGDTATFADDLAGAKAAVISDVLYGIETVEGAARREAFLDTINAPANYSDSYAEYVRAVSGRDVLRVLEREVTPRKRVVSVGGLAAPGGGVVATGGAEPEATP